MLGLGSRPTPASAARTPASAARRSADRLGCSPDLVRRDDGTADAWDVGPMQEKRARRIVDELRDHGTDAQLEKSGVYQFGIRIKIPGGREAIWDSDGTAGLEAQVMRDGMLVGFVPSIAGSEDFDDEQVVDVITRTDYDQPVATQHSVAPAPAAPLPRTGGVFRRFLDGFR